MIKIKIDIVGGSIGGLSTAITIKERDKKIKVYVHEKYKKIGYNHEGRRCGEAYPIYKKLIKWLPEEKSIFNTIEKEYFVIGDKTYIMPISPLHLSVLIVDRQEFISQLGSQAEELGIEIQTNDKIKSINDLDGDYIVDASGCPSSIKRELGFKRGIKGVSYQQTLENSNYFISDTARRVITESIGYYWIFPRNPEKKEINLGVGVIGNYKCNLKEMLELFKKEWKITGKINYVTGGLVPSGLQRPLMYKNILFVGDAGVGTFPFSGGGICRALHSGEIAGKYIAARKVKQYPKIINKKYIKWDLVGTTSVRAGEILRKIDAKAYLKSLKYFYELFYFPTIY